MNNKKLLIIFVALVAVFLLTKLLTTDRKRTFDPQIVQLDTSQVDQIIIQPKAENGEEITLNRTGEGWTASMNERTVLTPANKVNGLLGALNSIKAKRIVSNDPEKWSQYEVDEQGTRVRVSTGDDQSADFIVGTFKFDQAQRSASSYVRRSDEDEVFIVDGFLSMQFNQGFNAFRNNVVVKLNREDVRQLELEGPVNAVVQKNDDGRWYYAGMEALDSTAMAQYVSSLTNSVGSEYVDNFTGSNPERILSISGNNMLQPVRVQCFASRDSSKPFVIHSSMNEESYFLSDSSGLFNTVFGKLEDVIRAR